MSRARLVEGTVFCLPLRDKGFAAGLITRIGGPPRGVLFGYFFGPRLIQPEVLPQPPNWTADRAILKCMFGDLGLRRAEWSIVGLLPGFKREHWALPLFYRPSGDKEGTVFVSEYDDELSLCSERRTDPSKLDLEMLVYDSIAGYGSVEIKLTKMFSRMDELSC